MAKDKRSRDQKRKAKLAARAHKHKSSAVEPYEGARYRQPQWDSLVYATELAIYEVILMTDRKLTNDEAKQAFEDLVLQLRRGLSPTLGADDSQPVLEVGRAGDFLMWNIRRHWTEYFATESSVATSDLIGVLRTLLYSIEAHEWNTGRQRGYVAFIQNFLEERGLHRRAQLPLPPPGEAGLLTDESK
jgi:hypothetical protein